MDKVDVVICTKDRNRQLVDAVAQARKKIPCGNVIVVDSSVKPDKRLLASLGVEAVFTPNAFLGYARQQGLLQASTQYVVFLDDDVVLADGWFSLMLSALQKSDKVLAVSSKVVLGYESNSLLEKLHRQAIRQNGGSIGVSILDRNKVLALGGFNVWVHRGEDAELQLRMNAKGFKWVRELRAVAYHKCTLQEYFGRAKPNAVGWVMIWKTSKLRGRFLLKRVASTFAMPVFYFWRTFDPRVLGCYFLYKFRILTAFLREVKK